LIFKYKYESKGNIAKRKAPLVAQEFTHKEEIDYNKTPQLWKKFQLDIMTSYLNIKLDGYNMYIPENHEKYKKYY